MDQLILQSSDEIAWHGFVTHPADNIYCWYDIIMYPQSNSAARSTSDDEEYTKWLIKQMNYKNFDELRLHGHSHVNMGCTPSGLDMSYRQDILANLRPNDFYIFLIANKKHTINIEIYDHATNVCYETADIDILITSLKDVEKAKSWAETAIKNNVKEKEKCLTIPSPKSTSIPTNLKHPSTSSDAEQLDAEWRKHWRDSGYED